MSHNGFEGNGNGNGNGHGNGQAHAHGFIPHDLSSEWTHYPRWAGIIRPYSAHDVYRLRGNVLVEHTLAKIGAQRFWELLHTDRYVPALGALTGNQAIEQVRAGLKAIYVSGWQVAADNNGAG